MNPEILSKACSYVGGQLKEIPSLAMILGSGLGSLADELIDSIHIDYSDIPGFPVSTAPGHVSRLVFGYLNSKPIIIFQGRFHLYEGYSMDEIAFPIRFLKMLGCRQLIITNASGGINRSFVPGDLIVIKDHINFTGKNPLIGENLESFGSRFPDMSNPYSLEMEKHLFEAANNIHLSLKKGTYASMTGPSFETPSEIKMLRIVGADAIGMSTVPEVITAVHSGLEVLGISCISNMAAGILDQPITSEEVIEAGKEVRERFSNLLKELMKLL